MYFHYQSFFDLFEIIEEIFHSKELAVHLRKVYPNESGSLDCFAFVRWYVDNVVYLESSEEEDRLVVQGYKVILIDLQ